MKNKIPRISTRGYYDLGSGKRLKNNDYFLYPGIFFKKLYGKKELVIMIHGLRNDSSGAVEKIKIARQRLSSLGYRFPVVGYSYDSNTKGAHIKSTSLKALKTGQMIAQKNGSNLSKFIIEFKKNNPLIKIRLIGHSLGSQVILSAIEKLSKNNMGENSIESVHLFGASILANAANPKTYGNSMQKVIRRKLVNYYAPSDEVLKEAHDDNSVKNPLGLNGSIGNTISKYSQKKVRPINHRFASYAKTINSFP